jgi:hypothetical protein
VDIRWGIYPPILNAPRPGRGAPLSVAVTIQSFTRHRLRTNSHWEPLLHCNVNDRARNQSDEQSEKNTYRIGANCAHCVAQRGRDCCTNRDSAGCGANVRSELGSFFTSTVSVHSIRCLANLFGRYRLATIWLGERKIPSVIQAYAENHGRFAASVTF